MVGSIFDGARRPSTSTSSAPNSEPPSLRASPQLGLEPSIDGPPSPQGIRAYTEQMKRNVISSHGRTRTNSTVSSFSSDSGSPELKRQTSKKSMAGLSMRSDRPDSIQIFGKSLFSRGSRKSKIPGGRASSLSLHQRDSQYTGVKVAEESSKKHMISGPYNFQHVIHTGLGQQSGDEVKSRKSSVDDDRSQPMRPHASSISDSDYMSDATTETAYSIAEEGTPRPPRRIMRKPVSPINVPRLRSSQSHDSVRNAPPRPPRSPMMPAPMAGTLPPRTSSRTPSMIWDEYDPLASTSLERPHYASGFRKPQAFHLPLLSPPLPADKVIPSVDEFSTQLAPAPPRPQDNVGWPFAPQVAPSESGSQLADVPEEEELTAANRRQNRLSTASIRASRSVPNMQSRSRADSRAMAQNVPLPATPTAFLGFAEQQRAQQPIKLNLDSFDSWEDDIDYCYEHEVEADCDYNWERTSIDTEIARNHFHDSAYSEGEDKFDFGQGASPRSMHSASTGSGPCFSARRESVVHMGMPDPHVSPPSPTRDFFQLPEFDFASNFSMGSPTSSRKSYKPDTLHLAAPRMAEEFHESHGFTLSPSLLIPNDYSQQMEAEAQMHNERFAYAQHDRFASYADRSSYGSDSNRLSDPHSTVSIRSSNTSHTDGLRGSGDSSTSLANSFAPSSRHESVILERAAGVAKTHRAVSSKGSAAELGSAAGRQHSASVSSTVSFSSNPFDAYIEQDVPAEAAAYHAENSIELARQDAEARLLPPSPSPCAQGGNANEAQQAKMVQHGRKGSVPLLDLKSEQQASGRPRAGSRARASTLGGKARSYGLFPSQVAAPPPTPMMPVAMGAGMGNAF